MQVGAVLRSARLNAGMTIEELSKAINVTPPTLSRYETGVIKDVPPDAVCAAARALGEPAIVKAYCRSCPVHQNQQRLAA